jgi:HAMP domain-containing protein
MATNAPAKQRGALLLYGYHAKENDVFILRKQIEDWAESSRGAIAADAVKAMALGGSDLALITVDNIGRKFKNKQVKSAGVTAFAAAAEALGTTAEVLGDRIIPTLGFDMRGEKTIDYGSRTFTAALSASLSITIKDENGKPIKSLPKPGAKDDAEKAEAAKTEFSALKKSLKTVVDTQRQRLEQALATGRDWDAAAWEKLFVQNPIMHSFAETLIWGIYEDSSLKDSFRYMNDGSFTTVDEEEFLIPEGAKIGLVHPLDLDAGLLSQWKQQLEDYEIDQPFDQIGRKVFTLGDGEEKAHGIDRFGGRKMLGITLAGRLQKSGWYKGSVQDAGCFYTYYREIGELGAQLYFSGMYVSPDVSEEITIGQLIFFKAGSVIRGSYVYDDVKEEDLIHPGGVSRRLFSELLLDIENATSSATEIDEGWKNDSSLSVFFRK